MIVEQIKEVLKKSEPAWSKIKETYSFLELCKFLKILLIAITEFLTLFLLFLFFPNLPVIYLYHFGAYLYILTFGRLVIFYTEAFLK